MISMTSTSEEQIRATVTRRFNASPERVFDAVVQDLRREFGADPGRMPLQAIVFAGKRPPS